MAKNHPSEITLHQSSKILEIAFNSGDRFKLPCEYLRVFSPSAEVRAHTGEVAKLVTNKEDVNINNISPVGQYAIKIFFDDDHNSGLFDWNMLFKLGRDYEKNWSRYLARCEESGYTRKTTD